ncbi:MAG: hypothetical protein K8R88_09960 [Armatimonadetes bacterium]|nr:hypothetical protein [Armatimonadota bacterium]
MSEDTQKPETVIESLMKGTEFGQNLLGKASAAVSNAEIQRMVMSSPPRLPSPGEQVYEALQQQIRAFEAELSADKEVGVQLIAGPMGPIHVSIMGWVPPGMIIFDGVATNGEKCRLIQHALQVSLQLVAVPKIGETPRKIGFAIARDYAEQNEELNEGAAKSPSE